MQNLTQPSIADLSTLFANAALGGTLSHDSQSLLTGSLGDVVIAGAAGLAAEDIVAADVTLITILIDASSSIAYANLAQAVRSGQTALLDAFAGSRQQDSILVSVWTFADQEKPLHGYVPVADAVRLNGKNYRPAGTTVLYDAWCDALAANVAYAQKLRDSGTPCRSVVVVITDGEDVGSKHTVADCARLSHDLLASEQFVLAFVGVGDQADFNAIARQMGVPDGCIAVQQNATPQTLRQVFLMVSQSAIRASQGLVRPGAGAGFFAP
jgi:hypothetical protein